MNNAAVKIRRRCMGVSTLAGVVVVVTIIACSSPAGTETTIPAYTINVAEAENGMVSTDTETAGEGETVVLLVEPDEHCEVDTIRITGVSGIVYEIRGGSFTMPAEDVTVTVTFVPIKTAKYEITINVMIDGSFELFPAIAQYENLLVKLFAKPDPGKKYRPGSLTVTGTDSDEPVPVTPSEHNDSEWTFEMPGENVEIDAGFIDDTVSLYDIVLAQPDNGSIECAQSSAVAGDLVTVTVVPRDCNYRYRNGSLITVPELELTEITLADDAGRSWSFVMPDAAISITAAFEEIPRYAIKTAADENSTFIIEPPGEPLGELKAGTEVTVTLEIHEPDNYQFTEDSISVTGTDSGERIAVKEAGALRWVLIMPEEPLIITAAVEEIPRYSLSVPSLENGSIMVEPLGKLKAGTEVTITLNIDDPENYRYAHNSITVTGTDSGTVWDCESAGELQWSFSMPDESVTVNAQIEPVPRYSVTAAEDVANGRLVIDGCNENGMAREGNTITVTAIPNPGYKPDGGNLTVKPADAVTVSRLEDRLVWTFTMTDKDLEIGMDFAALGPWEIYKGGARKGINVGALADDPRNYAVDLEFEALGRNGGQRVIKVSPAIGKNGNPVHQSFGLYSDTEINLDTIAALSFWAKADRTLNLKYIGFGDDDPARRVVSTGEQNNQSVTVSTEWKRYIVPVPAANSGQSITRCFFMYAYLTSGNYLYIDDIEFIESGVTLTEIIIPAFYDELRYGELDPDVIIKKIPIQLIFTCADGSIVTLQTPGREHILKYKLAYWLMPFVSCTMSALSVSAAGITSNVMALSAAVDGLVLDDFEYPELILKTDIPANPAEETGYRWRTNGSGSFSLREHIAEENNEIHSGLRAGKWRPTSAKSNLALGGNFEAVNAAGYHNLSFWVKVTTNIDNETVTQKGTAFTFALRNGGTQDKKNSGVFSNQLFTFNADDWQEVTIPLSAFSDLDLTAITGYAFNIVDNQSADLRVMLDDIALIR